MFGNVKIILKNSSNVFQYTFRKWKKTVRKKALLAMPMSDKGGCKKTLTLVPRGKDRSTLSDQLSG